MSNKYKKKVLSGVLIASMTFGGIVSTVTPFVNNETTVHASAPIADTTSKRTITIHKYAIEDLSTLGIRGDGKLADAALQAKLAALGKVENVKFKIERVENIGTASLVNPDQQVLGTDYKIDTTFKSIELSTNANGELTFDLGVGKANDGIYLITELDSPNTKVNGVAEQIKRKVSPFFVYVPMTDRDSKNSLIYDIQVYPKNELVNPLNPAKTINGGDSDSLQAGLPFTWEATVDINPSDFYYIASQTGKIPGSNPPVMVTAGDEVYLDHFTITDDLDSRLQLLSTKVQVFDGTTWTDLVQGTDYTFAVGANAMNPAGKQTVELKEAGMKKIGKNNKLKKLRVVYETKTIDVKFNGKIDNTFTVDKKEKGLVPEIETNPTPPRYFTGGFDIKKVIEGTNANLAGALFRVATSKANADGGIYLATDGKSYTEANLPKGVDFLESTSDANGLAAFDGLALDSYDDINKNGKQDLPAEPTFADVDIQRDYWLVEVKAPSGYEMLKDPVKITVNLSTADDKTIETTVINKKETDLPFTGGTGTTLMIVVAIGAILMGTAFVVIDKKRCSQA
ncbi:fimbrial isopeptide formation D2 domain-containing protein [Pilibacter termitis]|uniref:Fimbrial isopeptide formation D2 domain-containing protein n=1 Tax=Pilibacter termitis TaxID=263852 RepID=A0A1T4RFP1_9ENTE|nr:SpaH/EbpB family LPXTG-anchored major pilin [Pilibacter termitis]SKA14558.1 fimbrial isopeptide formation D2 domain-containing protein [Pilibacter termitis]